MKEQKINYEAPQVDVFEVQVEKGFAASEVGSLNGTTSGWGEGSLGEITIQ